MSAIETNSETKKLSFALIVGTKIKVRRREDRKKIRFYLPCDYNVTVTGFRAQTHVTFARALLSHLLTVALASRILSRERSVRRKFISLCAHYEHNIVSSFSTSWREIYLLCSRDLM